VAKLVVLLLWQVQAREVVKNPIGDHQPCVVAVTNIQRVVTAGNAGMMSWHAFVNQ